MSHTSHVSQILHWRLRSLYQTTETGDVNSSSEVLQKNHFAACLWNNHELWQYLDWVWVWTEKGSYSTNDDELTLQTSAFESFFGGQFMITLSTRLIKPNYLEYKALKLTLRKELTRCGVRRWAIINQSCFVINVLQESFIKVHVNRSYLPHPSTSC